MICREFWRFWLPLLGGLGLLVAGSALQALVDASIGRYLAGAGFVILLALYFAWTYGL